MAIPLLPLFGEGGRLAFVFSQVRFSTQSIRQIDEDTSQGFPSAFLGIGSVTKNLDEHLGVEVARAFRDEGFRVVETRRSRGFGGRDEMDYLAELRRDRGMIGRPGWRWPA
jgi:hypothetical protein